ncbi:MAG: autotransporter outer membrane beta-barrel domain-containing protein [Schwartzia sp. (in: firmicutes)]
MKRGKSGRRLGAAIALALVQAAIWGGTAAAEQTKTEFSEQMTSEASGEYVDGGVAEAGKNVYTFTKDTTITVDKPGTYGAYHVRAPKFQKGVTIEALTSTITINSGIKDAMEDPSNPSYMYGIYGHSGEGTIKVKELKINLDGARDGKPDVWDGTAFHTSAKYTVTGNLSIHGKNLTRDFVGIHADGEGDFKHTGDLEVTYENLNKDIYAIKNEGGKVSINVASGVVETGHTVKLNGSVCAEGETHLALDNAQSFLKGKIVGGGWWNPASKANLYLQNGAQWIHQSPFEADKDSDVLKLAGGSTEGSKGYILPSDGTDIVLNNYSGHTRAYWTHEADTPTVLNGGNIRIKDAEAGSVFYLATSRDGVTGDNEEAVLNALANKLYYEKLKTDENDTNLAAKAELLEGLVSSTVSKTVNVMFDKTSGRAFYTSTTPQSVNAFTASLTGALPADQAYVDGHVRRSDGSYVFTMGKTTITATDQAAVAVTGDATLDLRNNDMAVSATGSSAGLLAGMSASGIGANLSVGGVHELSVTAENSADGKASAGIFAENGGTVHIENPSGVLKLSATGKAARDTAGIIAKGNAHVTVDGIIEMDADGDEVEDASQKKNKGAKQAILSDSATVTVGGGTISAVNGAHIARLEGSNAAVQINIKNGEAGAYKTTLKGDIVDHATNAAVSIGLGKGSSWEGNYIAKADASPMLNVYLKEGGTWSGKSSAPVSLLQMGGESVWNNAGTAVVKRYIGDTTNNLIDMQKTDAADTLTIERFSGKAMVTYAHDKASPTTIHGSRLVIDRADAGSEIVLRTDAAGLDLQSTGVGVQNLNNMVLEALAKKLTYKGASRGEAANLKASVEIAEGLAASKATLKGAEITYDPTSGEGIYHYDKPQWDPAETGHYDQPITGKAATDQYWSAKGIFKDGVYTFMKDSEIIAGLNKFEGGPGWPYGKMYSAVIDACSTSPVTTLDLKGHNLTLRTEGKGLNGVIGIMATGMQAGSTPGVVEIHNAGAINISALEKGSGYGTSLFVDGGGKIMIHNGGENLDKKVLTLRGRSEDRKRSTGIKTLNNVAGVRSQILIDGLVDIEVGGENPNPGTDIEGISNVASTISIGGGTVKIVGDGIWAIRSYGEFTSDNKAYVYFNAVHDGVEGDATGSGKNRAIIEGGIGVSGGMKLNGSINIGFGTPDSYFKGDVLNERDSYKPNEGKVNLWFTKGSQWTGNNKSAGGSTNVYMDGATWTGFSEQTEKYLLELKNGSLWKNTGTSGVGTLKAEGEKNVLDMTADTVGDVTIENYSGKLTAYYAHDPLTPTTIKGGNITIKKAQAGSVITLRTERTGIGLSITPKINAVFEALAKKLTYEDWQTNGANLTGRVEIGEDLLLSSQTIQTGTINFAASGTGQGSLEAGSTTPGGAIDKVVTTQITGHNVIHENTLFSITAKDPARDAVVAAVGNHAATDVVATGKNIAIEAKSEDGSDKACALYAEGNNGSVEMTAKNIDVEVSGAAGSAALIAKDGGRVTLTAEETARLKGAVENRGTGGVKLDAKRGEVQGNLVNTGGGAMELSAKDLRIVGQVKNKNGSTMRVEGKTDGKITLGTQEARTTIENDASSRIVVGGRNRTTVVWGDTINRNPDSSATTIILDGAASSYHGAIDPSDLELLNGASWDVGTSMNSEIGTLTASKGVIRQPKGNAKTLTIDKLSGTVTVNYASDYLAADKTLAIDAAAGKVTLKGVDAAKENAITIRTDNTNIPKAGLSNTAAWESALTALANKLVYGAAGDIHAGQVAHLKAVAMINEGLVAPWAKADIVLAADGNNTIAQMKTGVETSGGGSIEMGEYETGIMKGARAAMTSAAMVWRAETNDLDRRMGDLRFDAKNLGAWAHIYGGRASSDKGGANFRTNYRTVQAGYDWQAGKNWKMGAAFSYMTGSSGYGHGGDGDHRESNLAFYGVYQIGDGSHFDFIAKVGQLSNDYTIFNDDGKKIDGDYRTTGFSLSAEYGKKFRQKSGFYFEPQVELTYGYLQGKDYDAKSNYSDHRSLHVSQSSFNSLIGRAGIAFGYETETSTVFAKFMANREFSGGFSTSYTAEGIAKNTREEYGGNWLTMQIGGTVKVGDNCRVYGSFEKSVSGAIKTDWRADIGVRWAF